MTVPILLSKLYKVKCRVISVEKGAVKVEFEVDETHSNPMNSLHGGCTAALADIFTTLAVLTANDGQHPGVSVDLNVS